MLSMRSDNFSRLSLNLPSASAAAAAPFPPDLSVSISEYASDNSSATNSETMVSLLVADELSDAYSEMDTLKSGGKGAAAAAEADGRLSESLEKLSERIESIAASLEQT